MTIGELKEQFERLGANDNTKLYLVRLAACERDTGYEPICVMGFQQKGVGIFFYGPDGKEKKKMTIDDAIYCMKSYLPDIDIEHCLDCPYYGTVHNDQTAVCRSSDAHRLAITALEKMKMGEQQ